MLTSVVGDAASIWVPALLIAVGVLGIIVPVLPGLVLVLVGIGIWCWDTGGTVGWTVFGIAAALFAAGLLLQYVLPGRRLRDAGVGRGTLAVAVVGAVVGFFVIPVVGAIVGFVLAIFVVESGRSRDRAQAWGRTTAALRAVLHSVGIELLTALAMAATWAAAVVLAS